MPGVRDIFCQRSVNYRYTSLIGYQSQSISNERQICNTLPSKQAVAGSSPVSRSTDTTSLFAG